MKKLLLYIVAILTSASAMADDSGKCGNDVTYVYTESNKTLTISGTGPMYDFNPAYSYNPTRPWYSYQTHILNIIIENGVSTIGGYAFIECVALTSVTIGNDVTTIGGNAFANCEAITSIHIPNSVTVIGSNAFENCSNLNHVAISQNITTIDNYAFNNCKKLTSITIPNNEIIIGNYAFSASGLNSINIPCGKIGYGAFDYCNGLTSVTIGKDVSRIGNHAFHHCSLTSVTAQNPAPIDIIDVFDKTNATLYVPKGSKSAYQAAYHWKEFKNIVELDPSGIDEISIQENGFDSINQEETIWYTLDGKRANKPQYGLNVIRMSDGTTKKVFVK